MSGDQCGMNGRIAVGVPRVDCGRGVDQNPHGLQVPVPTGKVQRRVVVRQEAFVDDGSVTKQQQFYFGVRRTANGGWRRRRGFQTYIHVAVWMEW